VGRSTPGLEAREDFGFSKRANREKWMKVQGGTVPWDQLLERTGLFRQSWTGNGAVRLTSAGNVPRLPGVAGSWKSGKIFFGENCRDVPRMSFGGLTKEKRGTYPGTGDAKNQGTEL